MTVKYLTMPQKIQILKRIFNTAALS